MPHRGIDAAGWAAMKRFASPQELAPSYVFLCSEKSGYATGSTIFSTAGCSRRCDKQEHTDGCDADRSPEGCARQTR